MLHYVKRSCQLINSIAIDLKDHKEQNVDSLQMHKMVQLNCFSFKMQKAYAKQLNLTIKLSAIVSN